MFRDRYEPGEVIGSGQCGRVFLAVDKKLNIKRAVKEITIGQKRGRTELSRTGAKAEFYFLRNLRHKCLPQILDIYEENDAVYIVMDYVEGVDLQTELAEKGAFPKKEVLKIGLCLCDILIYLHSQKEPVIYRDLKPANVIRTGEGEIKLVDLGACAKLGTSQSGVSIGSPKYAAPEQLRGDFSVASDIYSLGRTLEALLGGVKKSSPLGVVINRCTKNEPAERFSKVAQVKNALLFLQIPVVYGRVAAAIILAVFLGAAIIFGAKRSEGGGVNESLGTGQAQEGAETESGDGEDAGAESLCREDAATLVGRREGAGSGTGVKEGAEMPHGSEESPEAENTWKQEEESGLSSIACRLEQVSGSLNTGKESVTGLLEEKLLLEKIREEIDECLKEAEENKAEERREILMEELREYQIADLSMLSTICKLLGQRDKTAREGYFGKAADYIEELFEIKGVKERPVYRMKLSDFVYIKDELGQQKEALQYLEEWEREHPESGKEFYFAHACMLLKSAGNEQSLERLYRRMKDSREVREDFRYEEISRQIMSYLGGSEKS
ncbi:MAG: serine/threonine protein kinase [Lachnospiraceae bacterium]|nr:serine/threonine protein kinase [Lachnospiraceae bacterium]